MVPHRLFEQLASGKLSAFVLPEAAFTPEGRGIRFVDEKTGSRLSLQIGAERKAQNEPGLEPGYKAISLSCPPIYADTKVKAPAHKVTASPSMALQAAQLEKRSFVIMYGTGSLHAPPLLDGGTVLLRREVAGGNIDTPTRVAVMMKGDMPGLAPGYLLVTPPQQQPTVKRSQPGWN